MEVVSEDDPDRDWVEKRSEYSLAGIKEYWIVDPRDETITILVLNDAEKRFDVSGKYSRGDSIVSPLLPGFTVLVDGVLDAE